MRTALVILGSALTFAWLSSGVIVLFWLDRKLRKEQRERHLPIS